MANLFRLLKPYPAESLPGFPAIAYGDVPPASTLLFYSGNKLTEMFGNRVYRHRYTPPAFHAALTVGNGEMLNVGKFKTIEPIEKELISTRRVDAIIYNMTFFQRDMITHNARLDIDKPKIGLMLPTYGVLDYLRFAVKWFRPTHYDICSENVVELLMSGGIISSVREPFNTAPWDLLSWAVDHPDKATVKTVWIGKDFKP